MFNAEEIFEFMRSNEEIPEIERHVLLLEGGSYLYGMQDERSDCDIMGVFMERPDELLSSKNTAYAVCVKKGMYDYEGHSLEKYLKMLKKTFEMVEWAHAERPIIPNQELKRLAKLALNTGMYLEQMGRAAKSHKNKKTPKNALHALRLLMSGIYLLENYEVISKMGTLAEYFKNEDIITELLDMKKKHEKLTSGLTERFEHEYQRLLKLGNESLKRTTLRSKPDPKYTEGAETYLKKERLNMLKTYVDQRAQPI